MVLINSNKGFSLQTQPYLVYEHTYARAQTHVHAHKVPAAHNNSVMDDVSSVNLSGWFVLFSEATARSLVGWWVPMETGCLWVTVGVCECARMCECAVTGLIIWSICSLILKEPFLFIFKMQPESKNTKNLLSSKSKLYFLAKKIINNNSNHFLVAPEVQQNSRLLVDKSFCPSVTTRSLGGQHLCLSTDRRLGMSSGARALRPPKKMHPIRINCPPTHPNFPWKDTLGRWQWNGAPRASWETLACKRGATHYTAELQVTVIHTFS